MGGDLMTTSRLTELVSNIAQIGAYILAVILIIQIIRAILGGTWEVEDIILALLIFNLTITFGIGGYLISLNNKISGHLGWHKGKELTEKKK